MLPSLWPSSCIQTISYAWHVSQSEHAFKWKFLFPLSFSLCALTANSVTWNIDGGVISIRFDLLNNHVTSTSRSRITKTIKKISESLNSVSMLENFILPLAIF